jgi:hypothetical protein
MKKYIGYRAADRLTAWAKYFQDHVKPSIHPDAAKALAKGPLPQGSLPSIAQISSLLNTGYTDFETGYTLEKDGSLRVAVLTQMPHNTAAMWDWWFGWHGSQDSRYKLWHPTAHRSAVWADGRDDVAYIGRVSKIEEYIGKSLEKANIAFQDPRDLGLPAANITDPRAVVFICARLGYTRLPLDFGWLIHQIRHTDYGAEMRSRFWLGGPHIAFRGSWLPAYCSKILQKTVRLPASQAIELLTHCSEEMNHLASFLPTLYAELHSPQLPPPTQH